MKKKYLANLLAVFTLSSAFPAVAGAELIFSAPPRGTEAQERATYEPFAHAMSEWLGTPVVYEYSKDFITYSFRMREGRYDIEFGGPHFAAWRTAHTQHKILVNMPGQLSFVVITAADNHDVTDLESLVTKKVCAQAPPQLGTLLLWAEYPNPVREPILQPISGEGQVYEGLKSGQCSVAILRNSTFEKLNFEERKKYKVIHTTRSVPNTSVSVGPRVNEQQQRVLIEKLTHPETAKPAQPALDRFGKGATAFLVAKPEDYKGLDVLLETYSFGWK